MKKTLAIILAILMVVTTIPMVALPASAALAPTATGGCNGNHSGYTQIKLNGGTTHRITKAGNYYINSSIYESTYSPALTIECSGTVTICFNGYDICHTGYGSRVVYLSPNGGELTVNLCDCKGTGEIYHEKGDTGIDFAPGVITLNMYGGTIRDCNSGLSTWSNSTVNMYGGTIKNCSYYGIYQDSNNGKVNIYGGSIINNNEGIRVCSADSVTLTGSPVISGNTNGDLYYRRPNSAVVAKDLSVSSPITIGQDREAAGDYAVVKVDSADMLGSFKYINNTKQLFYNNNQIFVHGDSHSFKDATCAAPKTCTICGATEGVADNTAHATWGEGVLTRPTKTEEGYYTYTCSACGATKTEAAQRAANYAEYTKALNDLRAYLDSDKLTDDVKASVAEWLEIYDSDEAYKFIAGEEETVNLYIEAALYYATEIEAAIQDCLAGNHSGNGEYCDICGAALHICDFTGEWKYDTEKHWKECECGAKEQIASHEDTLVQAEAKAPTCSAAGYEAYEYCTACDYSTYEEIPASTHIDANCDYKCDYNCGYVYETLDFSDAKVLSTNNGYLYIDGEKISVVYNTFNEPIQKIPGGKYILEGDMNSSGAYARTLSDAVSINLNGYTWDFGKKYLSLYGAVSIYDTSIGETGKMTSSFQRTIELRDGSELNLYSGTVENNSENDYSYSLQALTGTANLYGGKLKSNKYAINCNLRNPEIINLVGTVLESGEGYGQLRTPVTLYDDEIPEIVIDVSDYNGIDLTLQLDFYGYTDYVGKYTLIKGVENAEEAEKYKIKINYPEYQPDVYVEEIGYDEATGEIYLYTATNAFTQQPSVENDYTVDFNNPDVSFQWCEVEEKNLGVYTAEEFSPLFTYEFKAGDILKVSTDSEIDFVVLEVGDEYLELENDSKTAMIKIDADETIEIFSSIIDSENSVDIEFSVIKETALEGETGKTLQKVECGKTYVCKATVGENDYLSDTVNILPVEHDLIQVDAKAPTCTEIGWDAYEYCTVCDYTTYVELPVDPDAHDWSNKDGVCAYGCGTVCDHAGQTGYACAICGVELHTCDFTGEWKYDTEKHWKECECGEVTESAHVYTDGVCDVCGYECLHENWTDGTCDACGYDCEHAFDTDANIMTALTCERCGYTYKSDERWAEGVYETYYNGLVAMLNSYYYDDDEIVAYFALDTVDGEESSISFDWAINQGFTEYGEFSLHFYHNGKEVITHDFSSTANPYDNILSEEYKFTAEGETQIFKFVFKKDDFGYWYDDGRTAYLNIKDHSHVFVEATDTQPASCKTCNKTQCEIFGHDWSNLDSVCAVCGYGCSHEDTYNNLIRPVQNADGTWGKGKIVEICNNCGKSSLVQEVERDHEGYKVFDETAAELEAILNSGKMTDTWKNDYTNRLNGLRNSAYYQVYTEIETAIPSMTESLKSIIAEIEAGIADGSIAKADFTYMTSLFDEINALIDSDPNKLTPDAGGMYRGIYNGYYVPQSKNNNHSQESYNLNGKYYETQLENLLAAIKDGSKLKADYTEIDEAIAEIDRKLADENVTDEAKSGLEEIKADLEEMKNNPLSSKADLAVLEKALEDYEAEVDAGIEDGTAVEVDGIEILLEYQDELRENLIKKYGEENYNNLMNSTTDEVKEKAIAIEEAAEALTGTVAENAEKIAEIKASFKALFDEAELCLAGTHSYTYEEISPAKCGENAIEEGTCWFCGEVLTREVENSALTHSFTKYEVTEEAKCGVEGKEVAYCDNGCGETDEKAIEALEHLFIDYIYNEDATCTADGTKTAECVYGCGETDTVTAEDTMLDHADEDGDKICDDCESEIADICPDCGGKVHADTGLPQYLCMIITFMKLIFSLVRVLQAVA